MKAVCLVSSEAKDFVAAGIAQKKGYEVVLVHFYLHSKDAAKGLAKKLKSRIYLIDLEKIHEKIPDSKDRFSCALCKRVMLRVGEEVAKRENAEMLVLGEDMNDSDLNYLAFLGSNVKIRTGFPLFPFTQEEILEKAGELGFKELHAVKAIKCPFESREKTINVNTLGKLERKLNLHPAKILEAAEII